MTKYRKYRDISEKSNIEQTLQLAQLYVIGSRGAGGIYALTSIATER